MEWKRRKHVVKFCKQLIVTAAGCSRFFAPWYFPLFQLFVRSQNAASATESVPLFFFFFWRKKNWFILLFFFFALSAQWKLIPILRVTKLIIRRDVLIGFRGGSIPFGLFFFINSRRWNKIWHGVGLVDKNRDVSRGKSWNVLDGDWCVCVGGGRGVTLCELTPPPAPHLLLLLLLLNWCGDSWCYF